MRTATAQIVELEAFRRKKEEEKARQATPVAMQAGVVWMPVWMWMPVAAKTWG